MNAARLVGAGVLCFGLGCLVHLKFEPKPEFHFDSLVVELPALLKRGMEQQPALATAPQAVEGRPHLLPGERLFAKLVRHRISQRLQKDGFTLVGGDKTPLSREQVEQLLSHLDDDTILAGAAEKGAMPQGTILDKLGQLLDWLQAHESQIAALVAFFMKLLMAFGL